MKTHPATLQITALLSAAMLLGGPVFGQPAGAPRINPLTGMPESSTPNPGALDPATGLPASEPGMFSPTDALQAAIQADQAVKQLILNSRYDEALKRCLAFHEQYNTSGPLLMLLPDWIELGRRFPKARTELADIRNHDVHEFSAGRGYLDLFSEIKSINSALQQDSATYDLFKSFRDTDPALAQQCYFFVEESLVARGEYQWCYDHMGNAQERFDSSRLSLTLQLDNQKRMAAMNEANKQRIAEMHRQHGLTNLPAYSPPDTAAIIKRSAENGFVAQSCQLIEILVATGHKADAEKVRDQALAVLDDNRLKSAIADAEAKIKK